MSWDWTYNTYIVVFFSLNGRRVRDARSGAEDKGEELRKGFSGESLKSGFVFGVAGGEKVLGLGSTEPVAEAILIDGGDTGIVDLRCEGGGEASSTSPEFWRRRYSSGATGGDESAVERVFIVTDEAFWELPVSPVPFTAFDFESPSQKASSSLTFWGWVFLRFLMLPASSSSSLSSITRSSLSLSHEPLDRPRPRFRYVLGGVGKDAVEAERLRELRICGIDTGEESSIELIKDFFFV